MIHINGLWIGPKLSTMEILSIRSHLAQGHVYHLWCFDRPDGTPDGVVVENATDILPIAEVFCYQVGPGLGSPSAFSNLFRYKLLYEIGGWWADTDVVALKSFDFESDIVFASERTKDDSVPTTCVIKLPPRTDFAKACYESAAGRNRQTLKWGEIGPNLLGEMISDFAFDQFVQPPETFCPVNWFDATDLLSRPSIVLGDSYGVHLWHEMWRRKNKNKNGVYDGSLYEELKLKFIGLSSHFKLF